MTKHTSVVGIFAEVAVGTSSEAAVVEIVVDDSSNVSAVWTVSGIESTRSA